MAWFRQRNSSLLWNFSFKFHVHVLCGCRQKTNNCQLCRFQNGCLVILNNVQLQSTHCPLPPSPMGLVDHWSTISSFIWKINYAKRNISHCFAIHEIYLRKLLQMIFFVKQCLYMWFSASLRLLQCIKPWLGYLHFDLPWSIQFCSLLPQESCWVAGNDRFCVECRKWDITEVIAG